MPKYRIRIPIVSVVIALLLNVSGLQAKGLSVQHSDSGWPVLVYDGAPAFGYGPSPQNILTYLPSGNGNDYVDWVAWAERYRMTHVRSYPPSIIVEEPAINLFHPSDNHPGKFDLDRFDQKYFEELRNASRLMKDKGIFVNLQLWQAVYWKKKWRQNYYNPENNINPDISSDAEPGKFMITSNPRLLAHQKQYVVKILEATADLGNVYYDIANEIGNGTGSEAAWVYEILTTIRDWEKSHGLKILVTLNGKGERVDVIEEIYSSNDLIVKDHGRWDEHIDAQRRFAKPTVSVRNIDWDYKLNKRRYFFAHDNLEINTDEKLQIRGRKYWWRMFMARVQMAGAYADAYSPLDLSETRRSIHKFLKKVHLGDLLWTGKRPSYSVNRQTEDNFIHFRNFIDQVIDYPSMQPSDRLVLGHPSAHNYSLQSDKELVIYLESPNGNAGYSYPEASVKLSGLRLADGDYRGEFYYPDSGKKALFELSIVEGEANLTVPPFSDDLAIHLR